MTSGSAKKKIIDVRRIVDGLDEDLIFASPDPARGMLTAQKLDDAISSLSGAYRKETK